VTRRRITTLLIWTAIALALLISLFPIWWMISTSLKRPVDASVIDEDHFVRHADLGEHARQLVVQRLDVLLFVTKRDDDGDFGIDQC